MEPITSPWRRELLPRTALALGLSACDSDLVERRYLNLGDGSVPCWAVDRSIGLLEPDERALAGFSPRELGEVVYGEHTPASGAWFDGNAWNEAELGPEYFRGPPRVLVEPRAGVPMWVERPDHAGAGWVDGMVGWNGLCPLGSLVRIPVTVTWTVPWRGGDIAHRFDTTLEAQSLDPHEIWTRVGATYDGEPTGLWGDLIQAGIEARREQGDVRGDMHVSFTSFGARGSLGELADASITVTGEHRKGRGFYSLAYAGYSANCDDPPNCGPPMVYER